MILFSMTTNIFDIRYNIYPWMKEKCNVCGHDYYDVKQHLRRAHKVNNFQLRIKRIKNGRISSIGARKDERSDIQQKSVKTLNFISGRILDRYPLPDVWLNFRPQTFGRPDIEFDIRPDTGYVKTGYPLQPYSLLSLYFGTSEPHQLKVPLYFMLPKC